MMILEPQFIGVTNAILFEKLRGLEEDAFRRDYGYRFYPALLNALAAFRENHSLDDIHRIVAQQVANAIWSHRATERNLEVLAESFCIATRDTEFLAIIRRELVEDKGMVICSFRFGNYAVVPFLLAEIGRPVVVPVKPNALESFRECAMQRKVSPAHSGCSPFSVQGVHSSITFLNIEDPDIGPTLGQYLMLDRALVLLYADGNWGPDGNSSENAVPIELLGHYAKVRPGAAQLSQASRLPLVTVVAPPIGSTTAPYRINVCPKTYARSLADRNDLITQNTQDSYCELERAIIEAPDSWMSLTGFHRWRLPYLSAPHSHLSQDTVTVIHDKSRVVRIPERNGETWIDALTLRNATISHDVAVELTEIIRQGLTTLFLADGEFPRHVSLAAQRAIVLLWKRGLLGTTG
jgi:lauroyl/myristoyl acyltransferase